MLLVACLHGIATAIKFEEVQLSKNTAPYCRKLYQVGHSGNQTAWSTSGFVLYNRTCFLKSDCNGSSSVKIGSRTFIIPLKMDERVQIPKVVAFESLASLESRPGMVYFVQLEGDGMLPDNYFHLVIENAFQAFASVIDRFEWDLKKVEEKAVTVFLSPKPKPYSYQSTILQCIPTGKHIFLDLQALQKEKDIAIEFGESVFGFAPKYNRPSHYYRKFSELLKGCIGSDNLESTESIVLMFRESSTHDRTFEQLSELRKIIEAEAAKYQRKVSVLSMKGKSLSQQIGLWSKFDVVIAAHSAGLANIIWMKPRSRVFDIFPFKDWSYEYINLATLYKVSYKVYHAEEEGMKAMLYINNCEINQEDCLKRGMENLPWCCRQFLRRQEIRVNLEDAVCMTHQQESDSQRNKWVFS